LELKNKKILISLLVITSELSTRQGFVTDLFLFLLRYPFLLNNASNTQNSRVQKTPQLNAPQGNIYMGARYLDPKYSRWISVDPALGEYVPHAPVNDEAKKHNQNLPGMGGLFNSVNGNLYHYAGNNPVKYVDPDGKILRVAYDPTNLKKDYDEAITYLLSSSAGNNISKRVILGLERNLDFSVIVISGQNGSYFCNSEKVLVWDRQNIPYNKSTGIYNSAAISLFHELCHAWIDNTEDGENMFKSFVRENLDTLEFVYANNYESFFKANMSKKQFYMEQFVTELEKVVAQDLEGMNMRDWYVELSNEFIVTVNSVFDFGEVEK